MGNRGKNTTYNSTPVQRLRLDDDAMDSVRSRIAMGIQDALEAIAGDIEAQYGVDAAAASLIAAQEAVAAVEAFRWVKAGQARAAGVSAVGVTQAMGYRSQTSLFRFLDTIDRVALSQAQANDSGVPQHVSAGGFTYVLKPVPGGLSQYEAARRGYGRSGGGDAA